VKYLPSKHNDKVHQIPGVSKIRLFMDDETHCYNFNNTLQEE
jgi:hypothetical protein